MAKGREFEKGVAVSQSLSHSPHLDVAPLAGDEERRAAVLGHGAHLRPLRELALLQAAPQRVRQLGRGRRSPHLRATITKLVMLCQT